MVFGKINFMILLLVWLSYVATNKIKKYVSKRTRDCITVILCSRIVVDQCRNCIVLFYVQHGRWAFPAWNVVSIQNAATCSLLISKAFTIRLFLHGMASFWIPGLLQLLANIKAAPEGKLEIIWPHEWRVSVIRLMNGLHVLIFLPITSGSLEHTRKLAFLLGWL